MKWECDINGMTQITKANFTQTVIRDGKRLYEVEVWVSGQLEPWKVLLEQGNESGEYHVHQILKNEAEYDLDWYDNNLHQAFQDISNQAVSPGKQDSFARSVVEMAGLQAFTE